MYRKANWYWNVVYWSLDIESLNQDVLALGTKPSNTEALNLGIELQHDVLNVFHALVAKCVTCASCKGIMGILQGFHNIGAL